MRIILDVIKLINNRVSLARLTYNPHYTLTLYDYCDHAERGHFGFRDSPAGND